MMKKARLIDKTFICICDESTCLEDIIDDSGYDFSSTITEEIICEKCSREYKLRIDTSVIVEVDDYRITEVSVELYQDKNGNDIFPSLFEDLTLDEEVPHLYDGNYITEVSVELYQDKNGNDIFPSLFEDLTLDEEVPHLYDGNYEVNGYLYTIIESKLAHIFSSAIDPNQMSLLKNDET